MTDSVTKVLDRKTLRRRGGGRSFDRGVGYFESGAVRSLAEDRGTITAKVIGTRPYQVRLWVKGGDLDFSCTCPVGVDGAFCKHCVAVGLAWLSQGSISEPSTGEQGRPRPTVTMEDVRTYLSGQEKPALVELLMEQAMSDDRLRERLLMRAATQSGKGLDLDTFRAAIDQAVHTGEFVDYRGMYDYASGISEVVESIKGLLEQGHADAVAELAEYALEAVEEATGSVDDSDGHLGGISEGLQELHHAACEAAKPDPQTLAKRLFERELRGGSDAFYGAAETYADVLGEKGLATYRQLAQAEWERLPAVKPGQKDPEGWRKRHRITHIMEILASQAGDVEELVRIKSRDLSHSHAFLSIAEIYQQAGDCDKAMEWAERGWGAFPKDRDPRLRAFLVEEYHRRKRHEEEMALVWEVFAESPRLETCQKLAEHAKRLKQWPAWREKALACLREKIAASKRQTKKDRDPWRPFPPDHSELVRVFLWEKDTEAAWREANEGGCSDALWLELAEQREKDRPEDAIPIYEKRIERTLQGTGHDAYREAVRILGKLRDAMLRAGRLEEQFTRYLDNIKAEQRRKRNFMAMLQRAKWE